MDFHYEDESDMEYGEEESDTEFLEDESETEFGEEEGDLNFSDELLKTRDKIAEQNVKNEARPSSSEVIPERRVMSTEELMKIKPGLLMHHKMKEQTTSNFVHAPGKDSVSPVKPIRNLAAPLVNTIRSGTAQPVKPIGNSASPALKPFRNNAVQPSKPVGNGAVPVKNICNNSVASPVKQISERRVISTEDIMREKRWLLAEAKMKEIPSNKFEECLKSDSYISDEMENDDGVEVMDLESDVDSSPDKVNVDKVIPRTEKKIEQKQTAMVMNNAVMNNITKDCRTPPKNPPTLGIKDRVNPLYQKNIPNAIGRNDTPSKGELNSLNVENINYDCHDAKTEVSDGKQILSTHEAKCFEDKNQFSCSQCYMLFNKPEDLVSHWYKHTDVKDLSCSICGKSFKDKSHLMAHMISHSNFDVHTCHVCLLIFPQEDDMLKHLLTHDRGQDIPVRKDKLPCDMCDETFYIEDNLNKHMEIHESEGHEEESVCDDCGEIFDDEDKYIDHLYSCPLIKNSNFNGKNSNKIFPPKSGNYESDSFVCEKCSEIFYEEDEYFDHMLSCPAIQFENIKSRDFGESASSKLISEMKNLFTSSNPAKTLNEEKTFVNHPMFLSDMEYTNFTSSDCNKSSSSTLESSITKNVTCEICNKQLANKQTLKVHRQSHSGIKSYICTICRKTFSHKQNLTRHMGLHKDNKIVYICDICNKPFTTRSNIIRHMRGKHGGE